MTVSQPSAPGSSALGTRSSSSPARRNDQDGAQRAVRNRGRELVPARALARRQAHDDHLSVFAPSLLQNPLNAVAAASEDDVELWWPSIDRVLKRLLNLRPRLSQRVDLWGEHVGRRQTLHVMKDQHGRLQGHGQARCAVEGRKAVRSPRRSRREACAASSMRVRRAPAALPRAPEPPRLRHKWHALKGRSSRRRADGRSMQAPQGRRTLLRSLDPLE